MDDENKDRETAVQENNDQQEEQLSEAQAPKEQSEDLSEQEIGEESEVESDTESEIESEAEPPSEDESDDEDEAAESQAETDIEADDEAQKEAAEDETTDDQQTEDAIDDIVQEEADIAIKKQDEELAKAFEPRSFKQKAIDLFHAWWDNPKWRYGTLAGLAVFILLLFLIPNTRYGILNTFGVRATAQVVVLDQETQLPLKNAEVTIGGATAKTDIDGQVKLEEVKLGNTEVKVAKLAYADSTYPVQIGLGQYEPDPFSMQPVGTQLSFMVTDWLSRQPVEGAEAVFGESSALSNDQGEITLVIPPSGDEIEVAIQHEQYKTSTKELAADSDQDTHDIALVLNRPHYFVSNRTGQYDVYKVDLDGENEEVILPATGKERGDLRFGVNPSRTHAFLAATRDGARNENGYLMSDLTIINLENNETANYDQSERLDPIGWIGDRLIYVKIQAGASGGNPQRHRLVSLNVATGEQTELAASNYFNDVAVADDYVYFAQSSAYQENPDAALYRVDADGNNRTQVSPYVTWSMVRTDYSTILFDTEEDWFSTIVGSSDATAADPPRDRRSRIYVANDEKSKALYVDQRDGKGVIVTQDTQSGEEDVYVSKAGIRHPIAWLSDEHIIFRIGTQSETADYVMNINGGVPVKISDVSDVSGADRWYYYY